MEQDASAKLHEENKMLKAVNGALEVQIARGLGKRSSGKSKGRKGGDFATTWSMMTSTVEVLTVM